MSMDRLLDELADRIAERVLEKLGGPSGVTAYTSASRGPNIPGKSRAWALRNIKLMPGAKKVGRDWVITADAYEAWLSERDEARFSPPPANDVDRLIEKGLAAAGLRRAR